MIKKLGNGKTIRRCVSTCDLKRFSVLSSRVTLTRKEQQTNRMKHLMETMALNSVSSYEKLNRPTFTLNGQEYEVRNCYSEEEMKEAEYYILKDEQGIETFFLTPKRHFG